MNNCCALCRLILRGRQIQPKLIRLNSSGTETKVGNNDESRFERPAATEEQRIEKLPLRTRSAITDMVRAGFTGDSKRFIERFDVYERAGNLKSATSAELEQILQSIRMHRSPKALFNKLKETHSQNEAILKIMLKIKRTMVKYFKSRIDAQTHTVSTEFRLEHKCLWFSVGLSDSRPRRNCTASAG